MIACDVISFVFGSRMVARFGLSLALSWSPVEVFRFAWYRFGLFLYRMSSFFLSLSISFRFALLMIDEMALWHREGMSSMFGGSLRFRIDVAWVGVWVGLCSWSGSGEFLCVGCVVGALLWISRLAVLRSFVSLLSCLLTEFVRGVCSFSGSCVGPCVAIGQIFWARSWYALSIVMMRFAALSILVGVILV